MGFSDHQVPQDDMIFIVFRESEGNHASDVMVRRRTEQTLLNELENIQVQWRESVCLNIIAHLPCYLYVSFCRFSPADIDPRVPHAPPGSRLSNDTSDDPALAIVDNKIDGNKSENISQINVSNHKSTVQILTNLPQINLPDCTKSQLEFKLHDEMTSKTVNSKKIIFEFEKAVTMHSPVLECRLARRIYPEPTWGLCAGGGKSPDIRPFSCSFPEIIFSLHDAAECFQDHVLEPGQTLCIEIFACLECGEHDKLSNIFNDNTYKPVEKNDSTIILFQGSVPHDTLLAVYDAKKQQNGEAEQMVLMKDPEGKRTAQVVIKDPTAKPRVKSIISDKIIHGFKSNFVSIIEHFKKPFSSSPGTSTNIMGKSAPQSKANDDGPIGLWTKNPIDSFNNQNSGQNTGSNMEQNTFKVAPQLSIEKNHEKSVKTSEFRNSCHDPSINYESPTRPDDSIVHSIKFDGQGEETQKNGRKLEIQVNYIKAHWQIVMDDLLNSS